MYKLLLLFILLSYAGFAQLNELKVLSYNVLVSTSVTDNIYVLQELDADIIGLQEGYDKSEVIANALGYYHYSNPAWSEAILSRYPITSSDWWGVEIELSPGQFVYMYDAHLAAYPYQPYDIRDGLISSPAQAVAEAQAARGAEITDVIAEMLPFIESGAIVFLTGDFNEPSHLDWTANAAANGLHFGWEVQWPTSLMCTDAGLSDAYRTFYPDEVTFSGETWTPWLASDEVYDRIDLIYYSGTNVSVSHVDIVGPDTASSLVITPYASDHRAVLSTFSLNASGQTEFSESSAMVYPNPAADTDILTIDLFTYKEGKLLVKDVWGKEFLNCSFSSDQVILNLNEFGSKGAYFIHLFDNTGQLLAVKKLIYR
jgi:endonuclease/exonuclease/phosphatase family metal-dependent hydrolase